MSKSNYRQPSTNNDPNVHFSHALFGEVERSRMTATPVHLTTFNAGSLVPIYCQEVLPDDVFDVSVDSVIRQTTLLTPTMGSMQVDICAFFVPNRVVNKSWKAVMGENYSGSWTANPVSLAPLGVSSSGGVPTSDFTIPVGSVADYYGFPTQLPIPAAVINSCNDLKFRGYVAIWNEYFRDQNYQPPIPISFLNVYQGFLDSPDLPSRNVGLGGNSFSDLSISVSTTPDGSFPSGAVAHELYGSGSPSSGLRVSPTIGDNRFRAWMPPLKVNKLHDYFTSVLPSPQKGHSVFAPVSGQVSLPAQFVTTSTSTLSGTHPVLLFRRSDGSGSPSSGSALAVGEGSLSGGLAEGSSAVAGSGFGLYPSNLQTVPGSVADVKGLELSISDLRMASALQQVYETLARGGSRYREYIKSFFGLEVDDPFSDIPQYLGHLRRDLDLYQTAQTSSSESGNTPQGNLAAFGYSTPSGHLFTQRFVEHGFVHIFAIVRHRNIYSSFMDKSNFRLSLLDFYQPQLANISEQPVYAKEINPFCSNPNGAFGYQEAWAEYRFEPDRVSGYMRPGISDSLSLWNYSDPFDSGLTIATGDWLKSNSQEVLDRTLAVTSSVAPQFKGEFRFKVDKERPMPTYSVPGLDIL
nr:major capsid protein [Rattus norvegicus microvirus]